MASMVRLTLMRSVAGGSTKRSLTRSSHPARSRTVPRTSNTIIRRKDGRYEARGMFGRTGKRRRRSFFGVTADDARRKLTRALNQQDNGQTPPPMRASVAAYLRAWLKVKESTLRPESYRRYREAIELHLI